MQDVWIDVFLIFFFYVHFRDELNGDRIIFHYIMQMMLIIFSFVYQ